jgi:hypothetical protein
MHARTWKYDNALGIIVHQQKCEKCTKYVMHLYQAQFEEEQEYFDAKDHQDIEIQSQSIWKQCAEDQYHNVCTLEREVEDVQETIWELEQQLEQATSTCPLEQEAKCLQLDEGPSTQPETSSLSKLPPPLLIPTQIDQAPIAAS